MQLITFRGLNIGSRNWIFVSFSVIDKKYKLCSREVTNHLHAACFQPAVCN